MPLPSLPEDGSLQRLLLPTQEQQQQMSVDVRLCGSLSRSDLKQRLNGGGAPCALTALTSHNGLRRANGHTSDPTYRRILERRVHQGIQSQSLSLQEATTVCDDNNNSMENTPLAPLLQPPSWAVPARGETRLEPVCETIGRQTAVDLTTRPAYFIGRSPNCDVQLYHATSSRRHALLFHHSNGSCYIVDCGSAHGTFVNGVRIQSPNVTNGQVVPFRVRRGALIRFGGVGAPTFCLKSFSFQLRDVVADSKNAAASQEDAAAERLLRRNTRLNALGRTAAESVRTNLATTIHKALDLVSRKRSFDSLDSGTETLLDDVQPPAAKRMRCSSPPCADESPIRLVSPDLPTVVTLVGGGASATMRRKVAFSSEPAQTFYPTMITPDESSGEEDN